MTHHPKHRFRIPLPAYKAAAAWALADPGRGFGCAPRPTRQPVATPNSSYGRCCKQPTVLARRLHRLATSCCSGWPGR